MAKSVLLSAVLYPVYQTTALRAEKLPSIPRSPERDRRKILPLTDKFCDRTSPAIRILV
ncbi:MAG: hypothetical protein KY448_06780 [Cyanobacteria bacterium 0813]|nr:hypothetical protein [Cyanobacteria bacterium 0813]